MIKELAGETTIINTLLVHIGRRTTSFLVGFIILLLVVWALVERTLRRRKTEEMQLHIKKLEMALALDWTTSGLTPTGETNPK